MLWSRIIRAFQQILPASNATVRRGRPPGSQTKQRLEGGHRLLAPIVAKDELIEIDLELSAADAVIGADQPLLEVADRSVGQRHHRLGTLAQIDSQRLRARDVLVPCFVQVHEGLQTVGVNRGARSDVLLDEGAEGGCLKVWDHGHAQPPRRFAALFNGNQHKGGSAPLKLSASAQARLSSANPGVVDLHLSVERLARQIDHRSPELVEHHPGRFVSAQSQLTLEQKRRDSTFVGRHQVRGPKPQRQRGFRIVQNRPGRQRHLIPAGGALPASSSHHGVCALVPAALTCEAIGPATGGQILLAGLFAGELTLKFAQASRKGRTRHAPRLYLVAC
jgi:hypothetical protein